MWRNVSVLEGVLGAARYCAESIDLRSLQIQPAGPGQGEAPGSSEDTSFYSTKNGSKIDAFFARVLW